MRGRLANGRTQVPTLSYLEISFPFCRSYSCIRLSQAFSSCLASVPGMFQSGKRSPAVLLGAWKVLSFPCASPSEATPLLHCLLDCFVQCPALCHPSTGSGSHCFLLDLQLLSRSHHSPSLGVVAAQRALIMTDHVVHRSFSSCSPECAFGFVRSSCQPISHLFALQSVPALLAVTSAHVSLFQVALCSTLSLLSAVEPHLPWPWPSRFTTIPVIHSFLQLHAKVRPYPRHNPQVRTNASLPCSKW